MPQRTFQNDVPIDAIIRPPQVREYFDADAQASLETTVRERGVEVPLLLRRHEGRLYLWDGARRLRAAETVGLTTVPALIEDGEIADVEVALAQVILNCQREDLTPLEKANAIDAAMVSTHASATQIAAKLGWSDSTVTRLLGLLKLPEAIQQRVARGEIPVNTAYEISRVQDEGEQLKLAAQAANGLLTRDALSGARKAAKHRKREQPGARGPARMTVQLGAGESVTVIGGGLTIEKLIETLEKVLSRARQARTKGLSLATFRKVLADNAVT
jgi:ParB family chromosome partitioning protein